MDPRNRSCLTSTRFLARVEQHYSAGDPYREPNGEFAPGPGEIPPAPAFLDEHGNPIGDPWVIIAGMRDADGEWHYRVGEPMTGVQVLRQVKDWNSQSAAQRAGQVVLARKLTHPDVDRYRNQP